MSFIRRGKGTLKSIFSYGNIKKHFFALSFQDYPVHALLSLTYMAYARLKFSVQSVARASRFPRRMLSIVLGAQLKWIIAMQKLRTKLHSKKPPVFVCTLEI